MSLDHMHVDKIYRDRMDLEEAISNSITMFMEGRWTGITVLGVDISMDPKDTDPELGHPPVEVEVMLGIR